MRNTSAANWRWLLLLFYAAATMLANGHAAGAPLLRTVAVTGHQALGLPEGAKFFDLYLPVINNAGQTAFRGFLEVGSGDVTNLNREGLWSEGGGALHLVARNGSQAPGAPAGVNFAGLSPEPVLNSAGQLAFTSFLPPDSTVDGLNYGIWSEGSGSLSLVARKGQQAPDMTAGALFSDFGPPSLNNLGQIAFNAALKIGSGGVAESDNGGIWSDRTGALALVVREGSHAPDTPAGTRFRGSFDPAFNSAAQIAFRAQLQEGSGGVTARNNEGIWSEGSGSLSLVAREGEQAPGTPPGAIFGGLDNDFIVDNVFTDPVLNNAGQSAFRATLLPGSRGVTTDNQGGIWSELSGGLALVARQGSQAPDAPAGAFFESFNGPVLNNSGHISFQASLREGSGNVDALNNSGIWAGPPDALHLVAREGDHAPGTPAGARFGILLLHSMNQAGQSAFWTVLQEGSGDVTQHNDIGIWAEDRSGVLRLVVREGDVLDVDAGPGQDHRTVSGLSFVTDSFDQGRRSGFNDLGQLAFWVRFTDGAEGIFVSNLVAVVPEPASVVLMGLGISGLLLGLRWRLARRKN